MAQQGTDEQTSDQQASEEAAGKHRASDEGADAKSGSSAEKSAPDDAKTEQSAPDDATTEKQSEGASGEKPAPDDAKTQKQAAPSEARTEKQAAPSEAKTEQHRRGSADTSWAEPETQSRRHVDVGEIVWRAGNVVATVLRTLAFLFALVLIVNVVLVLVGVNPANGVAQFIGGLANTVILGFRDLFLPSDPKIALIVNSLVAAVFWVFVGELLSRLIRFVAARVK